MREDLWEFIILFSFLELVIWGVFIDNFLWVFSNFFLKHTTSSSNFSCFWILSSICFSRVSSTFLASSSFTFNWLRSFEDGSSFTYLRRMSFCFLHLSLSLSISSRALLSSPSRSTSHSSSDSRRSSSNYSLAIKTTSEVPSSLEDSSEISDALLSCWA